MTMRLQFALMQHSATRNLHSTQGINLGEEIIRRLGSRCNLPNALNTSTACSEIRRNCESPRIHPRLYMPFLLYTVAVHMGEED